MTDINNYRRKNSTNAYITEPAYMYNTCPKHHFFLLVLNITYDWLLSINGASQNKYNRCHKYNLHKSPAEKKRKYPWIHLLTNKRYNFPHSGNIRINKRNDMIRHIFIRLLEPHFLIFCIHILNDFITDPPLYKSIKHTTGKNNISNYNH